MAASNEDVLRAIRTLQEQLKKDVRKLESKLNAIASNVTQIKSRQ